MPKHDPTRLIFSGDGDTLAIGYRDGRLLVLDADTYEPVHIYQAHDGPLHRVAYDPNRREFITSSNDGLVRWWSPEGGDGPTQELKPFDGDVGVEVAVDPYGGRLACMASQVVALYDLPSLAPIKTVKQERSGNNTVAFCGDYLMVGRKLGFLICYTHELEEEFHASLMSYRITGLTGHPEGACFLAGSSKGKMICGAMDMVHPHGARNEEERWRPAQRWNEPPKPIAVNSMSFNKDGTEFVAACSDGAARRVDWAERSTICWTLGTPFYLRSPKPEWNISMAVSGGVFCPRYNYIVTSHCDGRVAFWRNKQRFSRPTVEATLSADGEWIAKRKGERLDAAGWASTIEDLAKGDPVPPAD